MNATVHRFHVADDPEAGSALALFLAAAGFEVQTNFHDGSVFISVQGSDADADLDLPMGAQGALDLAREMQRRMADLAEEAEWFALGSEFHSVA